jgi:hypothetical protein
MIELVLIVLILVLLLGRPAPWNPTEPMGVFAPIVFIVLILVLLLSLFGFIPDWRIP